MLSYGFRYMEEGEWYVFKTSADNPALHVRTAAIALTGMGIRLKYSAGCHDGIIMVHSDCAPMIHEWPELIREGDKIKRELHEADSRDPILRTIDVNRK